MTVSREVVLDLLPVYLAGDASNETRKIVEAYKARDPEIAALASEEEQDLPPAPAQATDTEIRTIRRTRGIVRRRSLFLSGAIFFCLAPLSVNMGPDGVSWLAKENPVLAVVFALVGVTLGILYLVEGRRLRVIGL